MCEFGTVLYPVDTPRLGFEPVLQKEFNHLPFSTPSFGTLQYPLHQKGESLFVAAKSLDPQTAPSTT